MTQIQIQPQKHQLEVLLCVHIIVNNTISDKTEALPYAISWLQLTKEVEIAHIDGGGWDAPISRKLWKWLKCACF